MLNYGFLNNPYIIRVEGVIWIEDILYVVYVVILGALAFVHVCKVDIIDQTAAGILATPGGGCVEVDTPLAEPNVSPYLLWVEFGNGRRSGVWGTFSLEPLCTLMREVYVEYQNVFFGTITLTNLQFLCHWNN